MSYTDEEEPLPPTLADKAEEFIMRERGFILDTLLLVIVAISLSTGFGIWPFVGLAALMIHTVSVYRGK